MLLFSSLCLCGELYSASPTIGAPSPRGLQRGTESILTIGGGNLADAQEIFFLTPGFSVSKLEVVNASQVKATIKIAPDAALGEHVFRVRTATGFSNMHTFWIGALPIVDEKEPNNDFPTPQKIAMNVTVHGSIGGEDVDYFAVEAKKGQRISVEVEAMRLASGFFDPYVAILDTKRFELAQSDDTTLFKQDGCLSVIAPEDGTYIVMIRESSYGGGSAYRLHIGTFPRPTAVIPSGGILGEEIELTFLGDASGPIKQKVKLPATMPEGKFAVHCQDVNGISPSGLPFRLSPDAKSVIETEPNDNHAQASKGDLPCAFHGIIDKPGDIDFFKFTAKKGQVFDVECQARRLGSPLDPIMYIYPLNGNALTGNDDSRGPDSYFRITIPNDGEYAISVTDHLKKGGPTYTYRIELNAVQPRVDLSIPRVALYSQERQAMAVPRGNRFATLVSAGRVDMGGDLNITAEGLPAKMTFATETMNAGMTVVPVVLEAAADAPIAGTLATFSAKHVDPKVNVSSVFSLLADFTIAAPGQSLYSSTTGYKTGFAVTQEAPFKITIVEPKVPLVHNGSMQLKIVAERKPDFKAPITIIPLYNPPGVGSASSVVIPEGQNEAYFTMNANGGAPVRKWKYVVMGNAATATGPIWVSSQLATIEIAPPYMGLTFERGAVEQGKETQIFVKISNTKPFAGNAKIKLIGLPAKVTTAAELEINKDTKEIPFPIKTEATAPAGIHRNLFCQITIMENGEPIVHNIGATELRIDVPLPPKKDQPMVVATPMPMPKVDPAMPPKRLSRLEQLRLEQEEREKAAKGGTPMPKKEEPKKQ
jgi:Bacterial pre-peptidase C-terminal domain